jgi:hypothetical protein
MPQRCQWRGDRPAPLFLDFLSGGCLVIVSGRGALCRSKNELVVRYAAMLDAGMDRPAITKERLTCTPR